MDSEIFSLRFAKFRRGERPTRQKVGVSLRFIKSGGFRAVYGVAEIHARKIEFRGCREIGDSQSASFGG
jgi:hypothetical protein